MNESRSLRQDFYRELCGKNEMIVWMLVEVVLGWVCMTEMWLTDLRSANQPWSCSSQKQRYETKAFQQVTKQWQKAVQARAQAQQDSQGRKQQGRATAVDGPGASDAK